MLWGFDGRRVDWEGSVFRASGAQCTVASREVQVVPPYEHTRTSPLSVRLMKSLCGGFDGNRTRN